MTKADPAPSHQGRWRQVNTWVIKERLGELAGARQSRKRMVRRQVREKTGQFGGREGRLL